MTVNLLIVNKGKEIKTTIFHFKAFLNPTPYSRDIGFGAEGLGGDLIPLV